MVRWEPDSRARLAEAALGLFAERGYEETTVAAIAERAGLTERTFFRHFADKREVLFSGNDEFEMGIIEAVSAAPPEAPPLDAVAAGLFVAAAWLEERRPFARRRAAVIQANRELRERELAKLASLAVSIAEALRARGVAEPLASLSAETGMAVFRVAFQRWARQAGGATLAELAGESLDELRAVTAPA